jgi:hypothetical protein
MDYCSECARSNSGHTSVITCIGITGAYIYFFHDRFLVSPVGSPSSKKCSHTKKLQMCQPNTETNRQSATDTPVPPRHWGENMRHQQDQDQKCQAIVTFWIELVTEAFEQTVDCAVARRGSSNQ